MKIDESYIGKTILVSNDKNGTFVKRKLLGITPNNYYICWIDSLEEVSTYRYSKPLLEKYETKIYILIIFIPIVSSVIIMELFGIDKISF